jgi:hypothetical protein
MLGLEADHYGDTVILTSYLAPRLVSVQVDLFTKKTIWCMDRPVGLPEAWSISQNISPLHVC